MVDNTDETMESDILFKPGEHTDQAQTQAARQDELIPAGWHTPSGVTVKQQVETADQKNPGRRDVNINYSFEQENGSLIFVTYYTSPDLDNAGQRDYRFRQWASIEKVYKDSLSLPKEAQVDILDVIGYLGEGSYQVKVTISKDDTNMVNKIRVAK